MEDKYIVALEIGSSKIKGALGTVDSSGMLTVRAIEEQPLVDSVRYGVIRNVEQVANTVETVISALEQQLPSNAEISGVYVAVGARTVAARPVTVVRNMTDDEEITNGLLVGMRKEAHVYADPEQEVFAAVPRRYTVDGQTTFNPVGEVGRNISAEYCLISGDPKIKKNLRRALEEKLGIMINGYIVRQIAEANFTVSIDEKKMGCVVIDFGAETTCVSIYRNGMLHYMATLPMGSRNITRDIMSLAYIEDQAENLKRNGARASSKANESALIGGLDYTEINNYVSARALEIILNIEALIKYSGLTANELRAGIIIVGNGARLAGFNDLLNDNTSMRVRIGMPSTGIRVSNGRLQPGDHIDILSVLAEAAAAGNVTDCIEYTQEPEPKPEPEVITEPEPEEDPVPPEEPEPEPAKRNGFFQRLRNFGVRFVAGGDVDYDPDGKDDFKDDE